MTRTLLMTAALCALGTVVLAQAPAAPQLPDPREMTREDIEAELSNLRQIVAAGAVRAGQRPAACTASEHRQFDFWLGEWDVSSSSSANVVVAESSIKLAAQGCVIIENWRPFTGVHGYSLNMYAASDKKWHQEWMDGTGRHTPYRGVVDEKGVMRLERMDGPWPNVPVTRRTMNFERIDENTVRQWGEGYDPKTKQWTVGWDLTYRRRPGTTPAGG